MRKGLSTIEYAVMVAVIVAALAAMTAYLKRAVCGKWRENVDTISLGRQAG